MPGRTTKPETGCGRSKSVRTSAIVKSRRPSSDRECRSWQEDPPDAVTTQMRKYEFIVFAAITAVCTSVSSTQEGPREFVEPRDLQLFLLIGQSNMAGRGKIEPGDREVIPHILMLNKEMTWVPAVDPLHFDKPEIAGVGIGRSFAKSLIIGKPSVRIGLIPAAFGGTSLEQWKPGGDLYRNAVRRALKAMNSGPLRGILWHQGEEDAQTNELATSYPKRFAEFIRQLRQDLGVPNIPVIIGQLGEFNRSPFAELVNEQLALMPMRVPHCAFVSSAGLTDKGDRVHFDTPSVREFGRRYGCAFLSLDPSWNPVR